MGLEGFGGGGGGGGEVAQEKVEVRQSESAKILSRASINACSSLVSKKDGVQAIALESALRKTMPDATNCNTAGQKSSFHKKGASEEVNFGSTHSSLSQMSGLEAKQLERKSRKVARTRNGSSKSSRVVQIDICSLESGAADVKGMSRELAIGKVTERGHMPKQKNNSNSKRADKRNGKSPKSKSDSFCLKNGLMSFSSAAGGSNFLGINGSKPDLFDFTEHVDELSLNQLLDGSYKCPVHAKDKGKQVVSNENFLRSIGKAWSIVTLQKRVQPQNIGDTVNCHNQNASTDFVSSGSSSGNKVDGDKGDTLTTNQSCDKVYSENPTPPAIMVESLLHQPKDVLQRLALSPPKELDSLLLDAAKPALSSKNSGDQRSGRAIFYGTGLPPFSWSHSSSAHCKTGSDAVKSSTARNTCQGRCVKVENSLTPLSNSTGLSIDLESLTFNESLVPVARPKSAPSEIKEAPSESTGFTSSDRVLSSFVACSTSQSPLDEHSPRILAAAQTLYNIGSSSPKQTRNGMMTSPNSPSKRTLKTSKLKTKKKLEPESTVEPENLRKSELLYSSKKIKLSDDLQRNGINHTSPATKGPTNLSAPRSIRSSSSKLYRDKVRETKNYNINMVKKSGMMPPPPPRVVDKECNSQQKARKVVSMDWNPSGSKLN